MQTIKSLLKKEEDPTRALLSYRSTKQLNGYSPAELLFGRNIRTRIPVAESELSPRWQGVSKFREEEEVRKQIQKKCFYDHHAAKELKEIPSGRAVWVRDLKVPAVVTKAAETPRSYIIQTPKGTVRRNREFLRTYSPNQVDTAGRMPSESQDAAEILPYAEDTSHVTTRSGRISRPPQRLDI